MPYSCKNALNMFQKCRNFMMHIATVIIINIGIAIVVIVITAIIAIVVITDCSPILTCLKLVKSPLILAFTMLRK